MKRKKQIDYWVDINSGKPRYEFNNLYKNVKDPWHCKSPSIADALNNHLFIEILFFNSIKYESMLDIGCGLGLLSNELYKSNQGKLLATDTSEVAVEKAKKLFPELEFKKFDIIKDPPINKKFNLITLSEVLWYFVEYLDEVFDKLISMLDNNGCIGIKQDFPNNQKFFKEYLNGHDEFIKFAINKGFATNTIILSNNNDTKVLLCKLDLVI